MTFKFKIKDKTYFIKWTCGVKKVDLEEDLKKQGTLIRLRAPEIALYVILILLIVLKTKF